MDQLINSLPALLHVAGNTEEIKETAAMVAWQHVAGTGLRRQTAAISLSQTRLVVAVSDTIWKRQLESMSGQLLFRINSLLGQGVVGFLEFQVDPRAVAKANDQQQALEKIRPPAAEMAIPFELVSAAALIHDSGLRKAFIGAAMSCARRLDSRGGAASHGPAQDA